MRSTRETQRAATAAGRPEPGAAGPPDGGRRPWTLMAVLSVAQFMVILDATVVNVALPSIARSLGLAAGELQWIITAYVLASGGLVLLGGRAADLAGGRRVFLAGLAVFTAASLASGLAPAAGVLIAARAGQGLGAALLTPAALSVITTSYAGAQRATALGVWGALGGAGAAVGVLVMLGATGILVATFFLNSLYLQEVQGASALRTGLAFLPVALVIGAGAHLAARLLPTAGSRVLIVAGLAVMGAGALLLTGVSARSGYLTGFLPGLLVTGIGTGLVLPATAAAGGLAVVAALLVPAVRPAPGTHVAVH